MNSGCRRYLLGRVFGTEQVSAQGLHPLHQLGAAFPTVRNLQHTSCRKVQHEAVLYQVDEQIYSQQWTC